MLLPPRTGVVWELERHELAGVSRGLDEAGVVGTRELWDTARDNGVAFTSPILSIKNTPQGDLRCAIIAGRVLSQQK